MIIKEVYVGYGELRSDKNYSNEEFYLGYLAEVAPHENPEKVKRDLVEKAMTEVKLLHGDKIGKIVVTAKAEEELPF